MLTKICNNKVNPVVSETAIPVLKDGKERKKFVLPNLLRKCNKVTPVNSETEIPSGVKETKKQKKQIVLPKLSMRKCNKVTPVNSETEIPIVANETKKQTKPSPMSKLLKKEAKNTTFESETLKRLQNKRKIGFGRKFDPEVDPYMFVTLDLKNVPEICRCQLLKSDIGYVEETRKLRPLKVAGKIAKYIMSRLRQIKNELFPKKVQSLKIVTEKDSESIDLDSIELDL